MNTSITIASDDSFESEPIEDPDDVEDIPNLDK